MLPEDLLQRARKVAAERNTSIATLVREALEEKIRIHRPRPRSLGIGDSGRTDIARRTTEEDIEPEPLR